MEIVHVYNDEKMVLAEPVDFNDTDLNIYTAVNFGDVENEDWKTTSMFLRRESNNKIIETSVVVGYNQKDGQLSNISIDIPYKEFCDVCRQVIFNNNGEISTDMIIYTNNGFDEYYTRNKESDNFYNRRGISVNNRLNDDNRFITSKEFCDEVLDLVDRVNAKANPSKKLVK